MVYDSAAMKPLMAIMEAANSHDVDAVNRAADEILTIIATSPNHKARPDVLDAARAAETGNWVLCWNRAYQAMCGLTHAFPPAPERCPPVPDNDTPRTRPHCGPCDLDLPYDANFCVTCGAPVAQAHGVETTGV